MKIIRTVLFVAIGFMAVSCQMDRVLVPADDRVELEMEAPNGFIADLRNRSSEQVEIAVIHKEDGRQVSGFGLNKGGDAQVSVENGCQLIIANESPASVKISYVLNEKSAAPAEKESRESVSFTLANTSLNSIPLIIPNVMNPNLAPNSESGVDLAIGQEVFFKSGSKKYVLLVVDQSIENGAVIDAAELLKQRKAELGL
jgi:hypothetical protein